VSECSTVSTNGISGFNSRHDRYFSASHSFQTGQNYPHPYSVAASQAPFPYARRWPPVAYRGGVGGSTPPKLRTPSKIVPNSTRLWKLLKIAEFRTPTHQDVRKKDSKILKLPSVRSCFTLAMTNILFVIINSLKVPKIKKMLLNETKFILPNYSCLQNPWLEGLPPPDPRSLCPLSSSEFVEPLPSNKIPGYATADHSPQSHSKN